MFWRWKSRSNQVGRPRIKAELRTLIRKMAFENPRWGSPRSHGELVKLGFEVSERTVTRYIPRRPTPLSTIKWWLTFLRNHGDGIVAMDFFVVPTVTFQVLYVWFAIHHDRRDIVHFASRTSPPPPGSFSSYGRLFRVKRLQPTCSPTMTPRFEGELSMPLRASVLRPSEPLPRVPGRTVSPNAG